MWISKRMIQNVIASRGFFFLHYAIFFPYPFISNRMDVWLKKAMLKKDHPIRWCSPYFLNIYVNCISDKLRNVNVGCVIGNNVLNHLMYADDLVLIRPSLKGLQRLVNVCSDIGTKLNIKFNDKKTVCMIFRTNRDKYFNYNSSTEWLCTEILFEICISRTYYYRNSMWWFGYQEADGCYICRRQHVDKQIFTLYWRCKT